MSTIGFIGSGNMAEALIKGIVTAEVYEPREVFVSDIRRERLGELAGKYGVTPCDTNAQVVERSETVVLSVKPQFMNDALQSIKGTPTAGKLFISIAAGIKMAQIAAVLGDVPIIRVMPNTPALVGQGASALIANERARPLLDRALSIFAAVGKAVVVQEEGLIDAVTAVSGSGPAYFFLLMEAMMEAAVALGLPPGAAKDLVLQTAKGAGLLAAEADKKGEGPAVLRRKVTSPGGTTEAALRVFAGGGFAKLVGDALTAARDRSRELSG
ncbi:MAG: pyrroline-5-carboxylate reductase [Planctomycetes bacterium RBG_13_60_9]|nr:MAG: pyrroline-5-carboxylate reductase [Planctomycetes bacterium RBG_13_60_9]